MSCPHTSIRVDSFNGVEDERGVCTSCGARLYKRNDPDTELIDAILGPDASPERRAVLERKFRIRYYSTETAPHIRLLRSKP